MVAGLGGEDPRLLYRKYIDVEQNLLKIEREMPEIEQQIKSNDEIAQQKINQMSEPERMERTRQMRLVQNATPGLTEFKEPPSRKVWRGRYSYICTKIEQYLEQLKDKFEQYKTNDLSEKMLFTEYLGQSSEGLNSSFKKMKVSLQEIKASLSIDIPNMKELSRKYENTNIEKRVRTKIVNRLINDLSEGKITPEQYEAAKQSYEKTINKMIEREIEMKQGRRELEDKVEERRRLSPEEQEQLWAKERIEREQTKDPEEVPLTREEERQKRMEKIKQLFRDKILQKKKSEFHLSSQLIRFASILNKKGLKDETKLMLNTIKQIKTSGE